MSPFDKDYQPALDPASLRKRHEKPSTHRTARGFDIKPLKLPGTTHTARARKATLRKVSP